MTPRVVIGELSHLQQTFAEEFQAHAAEVIARRGRFIMALPGGSVGLAFFPAMAALPVDWTRVEIFWTDERAVPPEHPESNYALASRLLLVPARVPVARVHRLPGELPDLDQAARRAADELKSIAGDPPHLDLALLGVGDDGHVASIFPNQPAARSGSPPQPGSTAAKPPVIAVYDAPKPPSRRLTLTLAVLAGASSVIVAAFGASKADAMRRALHDTAASTPVTELLRQAPAALVLLDRDAGLS